MKRQAIPKKLRAQCFALAGGKCEMCSVKLTGRWDCDHATAHFYTGAHDVENLQALCTACHKTKTLIDMGHIAKVRRQARETGQQARRDRRGHGLIQSRGFSKTLRKRMDGSVVARP